MSFADVHPDELSNFVASLTLARDTALEENHFLRTAIHAEQERATVVSERHPLVPVVFVFVENLYILVPQRNWQP